MNIIFSPGEMLTLANREGLGSPYGTKSDYLFSLPGNKLPVKFKFHMRDSSGQFGTVSIRDGGKENMLSNGCRVVLLRKNVSRQHHPQL